MIAEEAVEIRLEVRAPGWGAPSGRYEVKIADLRPVTDQDRKRVEAERAFGQGERLLEQGTAEAKNQAMTKYESALHLYRSINDRNGEAATPAIAWPSR
jgi:hypothetical protein